MKKLILFAPLLLHVFALGQIPDLDAAQISHEMKKLAVTANVLYIAAHPDDENTRLISRMANEEKVRTAYLSLTRGDGGQNLIGNEKGALLGLIRTQELLEARKVDGGEQYFTRAIDFGYSKTADETLEKWDRDSILSDIVRTIREFKPDIIITRFPTESYGGHGHHTASAILAEEAFDAASDPDRFPESAKKYGPWNTKKLYFNASTWWNKEIEDNAENYHTLNVGKYNHLLGIPYTVMAAESRSRHRSQGFGALRSRGDQIEYLELRKGNGKKNEPLFKGIKTGWERVTGGKDIAKKIELLNASFDHERPYKSLEGLIDLYFAMGKMPDNPYKTHKLEKVKTLIASCGGLRLEFLADEPYAAVNSKTPIRAEAISQFNEPFELVAVRFDGKTVEVNERLKNEMTVLNDTLTLDKEITPPYWLMREPENNMFDVPIRDWAGLPENPAPSRATFSIKTPKGTIDFHRDLKHKWRSRKDGELHRPFAVVPSISITPEQKTLLFGDGSDREITLKIKIHDSDRETFTVRPVLPEGWTSAPREITIENGEKGDVFFTTFTVTPGVVQGRYDLEFDIDGETARDLVEVDYRHIETQTVMPVTKVTAVNASIKTEGKNIGYIEGSGDEIPSALSQTGFTVDILDPRRITLEKLMQYDAVIAGIRAYNTVPEMADLSETLNQYVKNGGNYVVQYNTSFGTATDKIGPYELSLSRDRVTVEEAPVSLLNRDHVLLNAPNKITVADFDGWVQERGLYFPDEWSDEFTALIGWNDPGESVKTGALISAPYGKGRFTYTGISFFRQLPAGVPGAYRLFANIVSNDIKSKLHE